MNKASTGAAAAIAALALTACGGGGGGGGNDAALPVDGSEVPRSAMTGAAAATAFVKRIAATKDDTASPLVVGDASLATSETDEPDPGV